VLEPADAKVAPRTDYEGKFSLQYSTAAMLVHGRVGLATYTPEALADEQVLGLARKVRYEIKEYASYPAAFPGGVRIVMRDGETLAADLPHQLGAPENPMTAEQVQEKFRENAALSGGSFEALEEAVLDLEHRDDLHAVLSRLGGHVVPA
jgi:2-methylcitrate dehydratase PrpD